MILKHELIVDAAWNWSAHQVAFKTQKHAERTRSTIRVLETPRQSSHLIYLPACTATTDEGYLVKCIYASLATMNKIHPKNLWKFRFIFLLTPTPAEPNAYLEHFLLQRETFLSLFFCVPLHKSASLEPLPFKLSSLYNYFVLDTGRKSGVSKCSVQLWTK